jgi:hypothetical protein
MSPSSGLNLKGVTTQKYNIIILTTIKISNITVCVCNSYSIQALRISKILITANSRLSGVMVEGVGGVHE